MKTCFLTQLPIQANDPITIFFCIPKRHQEKEFRPLLLPFNGVYHNDQHIDILSAYACTKQTIAKYKWFRDQNQEISYDPAHIELWFQKCLQGPTYVQVTEIDGTSAHYPVTIFFCHTDVYTDLLSETIYVQGSSDTSLIVYQNQTFKHFRTHHHWKFCLEQLAHETYTTGNITNQEDNLMFLYAYLQILLQHPYASADQTYTIFENAFQLDLFHCLVFYDCLYYLHRTIDKPSSHPMIDKKSQLLYKTLCQHIVHKLNT